MTSRNQQKRTVSRRSVLQCAGVLAIGAVLPRCTAFGQSSEPVKTDADQAKLQSVVEFLESERTAGSFPGAAALVSQRGKKILEHYTGTYHNLLGEDKPYQPDVRSLLYSYSKGISATVVVTAHQEKLIDIDATVASYLPAFAAHGKDRITLRQILTHSAGIPSAPTPAKPVRNEDEWKAAIEAVCQARLEWEPGSRTGYHALGMMIPAFIVRQVCDHKTWHALCQERLFNPLGATSLTFEVPTDKSLVSVAPAGATGQDGAHVLLPGHPAGGCFGTMGDALRVLQLHLDKGICAGHTILSHESFSEMHKLQYAREIQAALERGEQPKHENWAVGWLLRGEAPGGGSGWFGFRDQNNPAIFGHAGIDTVIGVADPATDVAFMFNTTRSPKSAEETVRLRNEVTNRVLAAFRG